MKKYKKVGENRLGKLKYINTFCIFCYIFYYSKRTFLIIKAERKYFSNDQEHTRNKKIMQKWK
jgi:hypothetical protein